VESPGLNSFLATLWPIPGLLTDPREPRRICTASRTTSAAMFLAMTKPSSKKLLARQFVEAEWALLEADALYEKGTKEDLEKAHYKLGVAHVHALLATGTPEAIANEVQDARDQKLKRTRSDPDAFDGTQ
jgi:hypothetical protein